MISYLIVDDEPIAHDIIEENAENLDMLSLKKNCYNVFEALEYLKQHQVDLIFLEINMPKINGFEFLKSLSDPPKAIVTTAYKDYAIEGYELNVVDYLLKPFGLPRFLKAVQKVMSLPKHRSTNILHDHEHTLFLKDGKSQYQVPINQIIFIEAFGNYTKVHTQSKVVITLETLASYVAKLGEMQFIQVHRSFLVSIPKIEQVKDNKILIGNHKIPIGQTYKKNVTSILIN